MALTPADFIVRWELDEIGTLDETAFVTAAPKIVSAFYTITLWFQASIVTGIRVLVNAGNKSASQEGWSVFLHEGQLVFRANFDGRHSQKTTTSLVDDGSWHHFAGVVEQKSRAITGYLDGSDSNWLSGKAVPRPRKRVTPRTIFWPEEA